MFRILQMRKIILCNNREVVVYWKEDGNAYDTNHTAHTQFISARQIHGNNLLVVEKDHNHCWKHSVDADALFSVCQKPLGVYVADCLPVVLVWNHAHAIIHCSWRTLHSGLLQKTLECFHHHQDSVHAVYLWPCIKWYEVGEEFDQYFPEQYLQPHEEKYLLIYHDMQWVFCMRGELMKRQSLLIVVARGMILNSIGVIEEAHAIKEIL